MRRIKAASAIMLILGGGLHASASAETSVSPRPTISPVMRILSSYGVVTSTFRTPAHNKAVGGMPNSYHLVDRAIDVARRPGVSHVQIEIALKRAGYRLVESLDERDHSHFAFAPAETKTKASDELALSTTAAPAPPPQPRVAADVHGTLRSDLARTEGPTARGD